MNQPHQMISELVTGSIMLLQTAVTWVLLSAVPQDRYDITEWTLLTLLGASGAGAACFCLNTRPELRKIIIGRCLVAVLVGVVATRIFAMLHPNIMSWLNDPLIRIGAGASFGFLGWHLSKAVFQKAQEREEAWAASLVKFAEDRLAHQVAGIVADKAAVVAIPLADKVEAVAKALAAEEVKLPPHVDVTIHTSETSP